MAQGAEGAPGTIIRLDFLSVFLPPDASLLSFKKIQKRKRKKRRTGRQCVNIRPAKRKEKKKEKNSK
jgi:hypothetical protein